MAGLYKEEVMADSPMLYWRMNDASKAQFATIADSSGNGNTGNYWSGCSTAASILPGDNTTSATELTPTSSGVMYNGPTLLTAGTTRTIEIWAIRTSLASDKANPDIAMTFTQSSAPSSGQTGAYCFWGGRFGATARTVQFNPHGNTGGGGTWVDVLPLGPNSNGTNVLVHQVIVWDDSAKSAELYINGVSQGVRSPVGTPGASDQGDLRAGAWIAVSGSFYHWPGYLDEFAIYNGALSATRIKAHYDIGVNTDKFFF